MRCGSALLTPFLLAFKCSTRTFAVFERSSCTPLPLRLSLSSEQFGVLAEFFSPLLSALSHSGILFIASSFSSLSLSSKQENINRFLIFEFLVTLAPDGISEITLRCERFFFGAHKMCFVKAGSSIIGGVTCTVDMHPSIAFLLS